MDIYLNNDRLEFTLNGEKTAGDVRAALTATLTPHDRILTAFAVDGDSSEAALAKAIDAISEIRAEAESVGDLVGASLRSASEYVEKMERAGSEIAGFDPQQQAVEAGLIRPMLAEGLEWVCRVLQYSATLTRQQPAGLAEACSEGNAVAQALKSADDVQARDLIMQRVRPLTGKLKQAQAALSLAGNAGKVRQRQLREQVARFVGELPVLNAEFRQTATLLQTGEELRGLQSFQEAVTKLQDLIAVLQDVQRLSGLDFNAERVDDKPLAHWVQDFLDTLKQVVDTFGNRDFVLLADLLEYEMVPRLERWQRVLQQVQTQLPPVD